MTTLAFPSVAEDWDAAFNSGLACGKFCNDPTEAHFWANHELLASESEDGEVVADWFSQPASPGFLRIARTTQETER